MNVHAHDMYDRKTAHARLCHARIVQAMRYKLTAYARLCHVRIVQAMRYKQCWLAGAQIHGGMKSSYSTLPC